MTQRTDRGWFSHLLWHPVRQIGPILWCL